jgi:hypothetical protein
MTRSAASRTFSDDGLFVLEAFVPTFLARLRDDQYVLLSREGVRLVPIVTRYAWPSELDLMARIAGLRLQDRWAGWERQPLTSTSHNHVSVYGHPPG